jgi:predicted amidohydrolase YtcJ
MRSSRSLRGPCLAGLSAAVVITIAPAACGPRPVPADRVFVNARIWTGDDTRPEATALAVRGDRIIAVGTDREVRRFAGAGTRVEDLAGRRVVPGFHDAHMHLPAARAADLAGARDTDAIIERLRAFGASLEPGAWLTGRGWTPDMFPAGRPHRRWLDAAFPETPVLITDRDGHIALANAAALALAGVTAATPDPPGGAIGRDADGLTGVLLEGSAMGLVRRLVPPPTAADVHAVLVAEARRMASLGLTAVQLANEPSDAMREALLRTLDGDSLPLRFRVAVAFARDAGDADLQRHVELHARHDGPLLRYGIAKGMLDGTVDGGTAAMLEPYAAGGGSGITMWEQQPLNRMVARWDAAGMQVQLHAIGDRAIRMALDAFEHAAAVNPPRDRRHRIEHVELPSPDDLPRFAALGVIASTQAIFPTPDATTLTNYAPRLGPARAARAMPFRALDEAGAVQAFGSDYPVFPVDPLLGVYTAVTRQLPDGSPPGGWYPEQRITIEAALRHYTWGSAFAAFREHELGTLAPGMLADFVVLSDDILRGPPTSLLEARVLLTVMGGRDTYRAVELP